MDRGDTFHLPTRRRFGMAMLSAAASLGLSASAADAAEAAAGGETEPDLAFGVLRYRRFGTGRPLLLLHGFGANSYTWRHLIKEIPSGYETYAIDLKGFGRSAKSVDGRYSLADHAGLIFGFVERLGLRSVSLVGNSMGGGVAILTALRLIDVDMPPDRLVLLDSIAYPQPIPAFMSVLRTPILNYLATALVPAEVQVRSILKLAYYDPGKIEAASVKAYARPLREPGARHALIETAKKIIPPDLSRLTARYPDIASPTTIIAGAKDRIVPLSVAHRLHAALPNATLSVIAKTGHMPHEETPEKAIPLIVQALSN